MWYEVLPSMFIIGGALMLPSFLSGHLNQWLFGNPMRRDLREHWDCCMFTRDHRLTGAVWKNAGLENIPDAK